MRVNPDPTADILAAIWQTQSKEQTALEQLSTGRRVNRPSDDPSAAASEVENLAQQARVDQYLQSVGSLRAQLQTADSTLSTVITALSRAVSLGVEGGNGSLTSSNLQQIAVEVQGILDQVVQAANISFQGNFLFSGTNTSTAPFTQGAGSVTYNGNSGVNTVEIADGRTLQSNIPGDQLFQKPGADVIGSLQQLVTALQSGDFTAIRAATPAVSSALNYLSSQRVFYGNALNQLDADEASLNQRTLNLQTLDTALVGADTAKAATALSAAETAHQAALAAAARVLPVSLLDYLK